MAKPNFTRRMRISLKKAHLQMQMCFFLEVPPRIELGIEVLQTFALPLGHGTEYLGHDFSSCPLWSGLRGSNPPPRPWQGRALPNELNPQTEIKSRKWCLRSESNQRHEDFQSSALPTELQRQTSQGYFQDSFWRPEGDSNP